MFVEEYLKELRREGFAPAASLRYVRRVAARFRDDLLANPAAVRSIWTTALAFFSAAFIGAVALALTHDRALAYDFFLWSAGGVVLTFGLVTCGIDLLRDRAGYRLSGLNLPTLLTLLRPVLLPGLILFLLEGQLALALGVYVVAALSDVADGWLARSTGQITPLGTVLDPLTDIAFNLFTILGLAAAGIVPVWLLTLVGLRYVILVGGGAALNLFVGPLRIHPTLFGRLTGVLLSTLVGLDLLLHVLATPRALGLLPITEVALGAMLAATVVHGVALGWYNLRAMTRREETPVQAFDDVRYG